MLEGETRARKTTLGKGGGTRITALTLDLLRIAQAFVLIFGLVVIYYASKGYRRTKSRSLLRLAVGFAFISVGAVLAGATFELLNGDL